MEKSRHPIMGFLAALFSLFILALAIWVLRSRIQHIQIHDLWAYLHELPGSAWIFSLTLVCAAYVALSLNDRLAARYAGIQLPFPKTLIASFIGYAFSFNLGHPLMSGGGSRARIYGRWHVPGRKIIALIFHYSMTFWMGFLFLGGLCLAFQWLPASSDLPLPTSSALTSGLVLLGLWSISGVLCAVYHRPIRLKNIEIQLPNFQHFLAQSALGSLQWAIEAGCIFVLLPQVAQLPFVHFLTVYIFAMTAGFVSQIPGGWGVFEAVVILGCGSLIEESALIASLGIFRVFFHLIPMAIAITLFFRLGLFRRKTQSKE